MKMSLSVCPYFCWYVVMIFRSKSCVLRDGALLSLSRFALLVDVSMMMIVSVWSRRCMSCSVLSSVNVIRRVMSYFCCGLFVFLFKSLMAFCMSVVVVCLLLLSW